MYNQDEAGCRKGPPLVTSSVLEVLLHSVWPSPLVSCCHYPSCVSISIHFKGVGVLGSPSTSHHILHMAGRQAGRQALIQYIFIY